MPAPLDPSPLPADAGAAPGARGVADAHEAPAGTMARRAVEAVVQTLSAPAYTLDAVRRAVVRYGRVARELALAPEEMLAPLIPAVRRSIAGRAELPADRRPDARPPAAPAELESWVQWWAIHGYHRAD